MITTNPDGWRIGIAAGKIHPAILVRAEDGSEIVKVEQDGRIFWKGREVETDDDFRAAMMELVKRITGVK